MFISNAIYGGERSLKQPSTASQLIFGHSLLLLPPLLNHQPRPCLHLQCCQPCPSSQRWAPPLYWGMWAVLTLPWFPQKWGWPTWLLPQKQGCSHLAGWRNQGGRSRRGDLWNGRPIWCVTKMGHDLCPGLFFFLFSSSTELLTLNPTMIGIDREKTIHTRMWGTEWQCMMRWMGPMRASRTQQWVEPNNSKSKSTAASRIQGR